MCSQILDARSEKTLSYCLCSFIYYQMWFTWNYSDEYSIIQTNLLFL